MAANASREDVDALQRGFGFVTEVIWRAENRFLWEVNRLCPGLRELEHVYDRAVETMLGKRKSMNMARPDSFHVHRENRIALHLEYDEIAGHEDDDNRLQAITDVSGMRACYVIRIPAFHGTSRTLTRRHQNRETGHTWFTLTEKGQRVAEQLAKQVNKRLAWMQQGLLPSADRPGKVYVTIEGSNALHEFYLSV